MSWLKKILLALLAVVTLVMVGQNTEVVTLRFLVWEVSMSRILVLSITVLAGFVMGFIVAKLPRRGPKS